MKMNMPFTHPKPLGSFRRIAVLLIGVVKSTSRANFSSSELDWFIVSVSVSDYASKYT